jgi:hypothetical protein
VGNNDEQKTIEKPFHFGLRILRNALMKQNAQGHMVSMATADRDGIDGESYKIQT